MNKLTSFYTNNRVENVGATKVCERVYHRGLSKNVCTPLHHK